MLADFFVADKSGIVTAYRSGTLFITLLLEMLGSYLSRSVSYWGCRTCSPWASSCFSLKVKTISALVSLFTFLFSHSSWVLVTHVPSFKNDLSARCVPDLLDMWQVILTCGPSNPKPSHPKSGLPFSTSHLSPFYNSVFVFFPLLLCVNINTAGFFR